MVQVAAGLGPCDLLARLHAIEASFGRARRVRNEARPLDLDLIDYDGTVRDGTDGGPVLPHPRAHERAFVLLPLADLAPGWRHPVSGARAAALLAALPADGPRIRPIEAA
jgi:2-amino-4-hydroxy-6-hydroxymethyldihydropteridine diphosphokinase